MKKLLFGLLLTVGVCGFSFGNTLFSNNDTRVIYKILKKETINNIEHITIKKIIYECELLIDCLIVNVIREYNICGEFVGSTQTSYTASGSACGSSDGGIVYNITRINNGFGDCHPEGPGTGVN